LKSKVENKSESFYHKKVKQLVHNSILQNSINIAESTTEKYFKTRRADIYFKFKDNKRIVVEVQNSNISITEIIERTKEYNNQGIYVLWILNGKGNCVASHKYPEHKKNVKISPVEKVLHQVFGERVYYINIHKKRSKTIISNPFALHYSFSNTKTAKLIHNNFESYYFRNSNFTQISNWKLSCIKYKNFKIARFNDKDIKNTLKKQILTFLHDLKNANPKIFDNNKNSKKIIKQIIKRHKKHYGKPILLECIGSVMEDFLK